jgi:hypothetical protein
MAHSLFGVRRFFAALSLFPTGTGAGEKGKKKIQSGE